MQNIYFCICKTICFAQAYVFAYAKVYTLYKTYSFAYAKYIVLRMYNGFARSNDIKGTKMLFHHKHFANHHWVCDK